MNAKSFMAGVLLIPALAFAEPVKVDKPVICDNMENVIKYVMGKFGEQPLWMGNTDQGHQSVLMLNPQTGTWSFLTAPNTTTACIVEHGAGFQIRASHSNPKNNI